jgi:hypothetical protein
MNPDDFHDIAVHLHDHSPLGKQQAADRTAVSRLYYAAFLFARDVMRGWGLRSEERRVHAQVAEGLKCSGIVAVIRMGRRIEVLRDERSKADYEIATDMALDFSLMEGYWRDVRFGMESAWESVPPGSREAVRRKMQSKIDLVGVRLP